jgi:hypothetical protein
MSNGATILFCLFAAVGCRGQKQKTENSLTINRFAKDSFYFATKLVDTTDGNDALLIDGMTAIIVPERMGSKEEEFTVGGEKSGFEMPCQCAFKNDTLMVVSALAWEGGFAYMARAFQKQSVNSLMLFGKKRKWKMEGREYKEEIEVPSLTNRLVLSKPLPLKENDLLYGWFEIKTPLFFETTDPEEEKESQQHILKIYFSCKVFSEIL